MRIFILILLAAGLGGCAMVSEQPVFEVKAAKAGDTVSAAVIDDTAIFTVTSETGIGSADVSLSSGSWPERILFRIYLDGLEEFKFAYGDVVVTTAVSSSDQMVLESVMQAGQQQMAAEGSAFYMPVRTADGYFELEAPADFLTGEYEGFAISWIDFFR